MTLAPEGMLRNADPRPRAVGHGGAGLMVDLVATVFRDVLGGALPDPDADFFELGGDSISAARVINRLKALTGVRVTTRILFETATPRTLAAYLNTR